MALSQVILDRLLALPPIAWQWIWFERQTAEWKTEDEAAKLPTCHREGTSPSHVLQEFAGDFDNPASGSAHVDDVVEVAHDRKDDLHAQGEGQRSPSEQFTNLRRRGHDESSKRVHQREPTIRRRAARLSRSSLASSSSIGGETSPAVTIPAPSDPSVRGEASRRGRSASGPIGRAGSAASGTIRMAAVRIT
jgi:hypothetical protein